MLLSKRFALPEVSSPFHYGVTCRQPLALTGFINHVGGTSVRLICKWILEFFFCPCIDGDFMNESHNSCMCVFCVYVLVKNTIRMSKDGRVGPEPLGNEKRKSDVAYLSMIP